MAQASTTGGRLHNALSNRNLPNQHSSESAGVLSPSSINPNDLGVNWQDLGVISTGGAILRGASYLGNGIVIIGDNNGIVYRSSDFGQTWATVRTLQTGIINFTSSYIGNGIAIVCNDNGRIFRTTDFGVTWQDSGVAGPTIFASAYLGNGVILTGDAGGNIRRSDNFGFTFPVQGGVSTSAINTITYLDNGIVIFADSVGHIFRSTTFGTAGSWVDLGDFSTSSILGSVYLGNGVALASDGLGHIFRSTDFGLNWTDLGSQSNSGSAIQALQYLGNGVVIFGDFNGHIFKSSDYGLTWSDVGPGGASISGTVIRTIAYLDNGIVIFGDNAGHIFRSDISFKTDEVGTRDHTALVSRNLTGISAHNSELVGVLSPSSINHIDLGLNFVTMGVIDATFGFGGAKGKTAYLGNGIVLAQTRTLFGFDVLYRSTDYGRTWVANPSRISPGITINFIEYLGNNIVLACDSNGHIFRSTDLGITWTDEGAISAANIFMVKYLGHGITIFCDNNGFVQRSTNFGQTWPLAIGVSGSSLRAIAYLDNGIVVVAGFDGHIYRQTSFASGVFTDLGIISTGVILVIENLGNGVALAGDNQGHVFRSTDFGLTWIDLGVITGALLTMVDMKYLGNGVVIFSQNDRIWRSTDYGLTWTLKIYAGAAIIASISYLGNGVTIFADAAGDIFRDDVSFKIDEVGTRDHTALVNRDSTGVMAHRASSVSVVSGYAINPNDIGGTVGATSGNWLVATATGVPILCTADIGSGIVFAGGNNGHIFKSTDHGKTFFDFLTLSTFAINSIEYLGNGIVLAADNQATGHIFRSIDYGNSWTDQGAISAFTITKIRYLGHGIVIFTDGNGFVQRSTNFGSTWPLAIGVSGVQLNTAEYLDNGIVLVGDNAGLIFRQTTFASGAFTQVTALGTGIRCIQYLGNGIVVAGDNNGHILRSTDFGITWTDLGDITGAAQIVITAAYLGNGVAIVGVVAGAAGKIFKSVDYGLTWTDETPAAFVSGTFFNIHTAKYLGNGVAIIADNAGNILRHDVSYKTDEFVSIDIERQIRTVTSSETLEKDDDTLLVDATAGNITIFLPSITVIPGHVFNFVRVDAIANTVIIDAAGAETINLALTQPLNVQFMALSMKAKPFAPNAGWWIF